MKNRQKELLRYRRNENNDFDKYALKVHIEGSKEDNRLKNKCGYLIPIADRTGNDLVVSPVKKFSFCTETIGGKFKLDFQVKLDKNQNVKPSKVIHIRNIPSDVSEPEIIHLGIPFGRVTNVLVLKGKNQVSRVKPLPRELCSLDLVGLDVLMLTFFSLKG
ncbi:hypothetical protein RUM43_006788 [Polyplax serrata]|uniref:Uncharacterized protein n=1 Tax=Polyplax serrata TaxID=468196 RepID=A0AAN8SA23_POLSC